VLNITWNTVRGNWQEKPLQKDTTLSPSSVYLRKNIRQVVESNDNGDTTFYEYEEAVLTPEEYKEYEAEMNNPGIQAIKDDALTLMEANADSYEISEKNSLIIMEAIATLYEKLSEVK
jgi:hypothetical protein